MLGELKSVWIDLNTNSSLKVSTEKDELFSFLSKYEVRSTAMIKKFIKHHLLEKVEFIFNNLHYLDQQISNFLILSAK